jgi:hypothetical protein
MEDFEGWKLEGHQKRQVEIDSGLHQPAPWLCCQTHFAFQHETRPPGLTERNHSVCHRRWEVDCADGDGDLALMTVIYVSQ